VSHGFKNIELSGGTEYYDGFEDDLLELKARYDLNYMCHNYFPPPKEHFVLNLASLNNEIYEKTLKHLTHAIELSKKIDANKFGFHAGFLVDIKVSEIGQRISKNDLYDKDMAIQRFCDGFQKLQNIAGDLDLYLENNVFSSTNFKTYNGKNFFMLTNYAEYEQLHKSIDFKLLLDIAHLKVSSQTLGFDFEDEISKMILQSDYIHVSDNDGSHDLNLALRSDSKLMALLKKQDLAFKDFTLEIYDQMDKIKESYEILNEAINDK
jgi:sugar phosphate isomerase/epimerase